jgi:hypothetical protein
MRPIFVCGQFLNRGLSKQLRQLGNIGRACTADLWLFVPYAGLRLLGRLDDRQLAPGQIYIAPAGLKFVSDAPSINCPSDILDYSYRVRSSAAKLG